MTAPAEGSRFAIFPVDSPLVDRWTALVRANGLQPRISSTEHFVIIETDAPMPFAPTLGVLERPA